MKFTPDLTNVATWEVLFEILKTFIAFSFGLFSNYLISKRYEVLKRKRIKKFYISWINFSLGSFIKQQDYIRDHINNIRKDVTSPLLFNNSQFDKLKSINDEELFYTFVIKNKGNQDENSQNFHKLGSNIEYLSVALINIRERFEQFKNENKIWNEEWSVTFLSFQDSLAKYILNHGDSMGANVDNILKVKDKFEKSRTKDQVYTNDLMAELINPIKENLLYHLSFEKNEDITDLLRIIGNLNYLCMKKDAYFDSYIKILTNYIVQIHETINKIKSIMNYFSN